jgi:hypothetical protein
LNRLVAAVADGGHSAFLLDAIEQREQELRAIQQQLRGRGSGGQQLEPVRVTEFVTRSLSALRQLLYSDVTQARAELLRHVAEIRLTPTMSGDYVAEGDWNLLGNYPEMDQARHLPGVRARLVAGVGFEPTTSGL